MFTLPDLPYDYKALEPEIDEETMKLHHDKHHGTYVKNLNDILSGNGDLINLEVSQLLNNIDKVPDNLRQKVINNGGQHYNHSFFWQIMSGKKGQKPSGELAVTLDKDFGGIEKFKEEFEKAAIGRFGSGWIWLVKKDNKLKIMETVNGDSPITMGLEPILGLDVWEHAYYLKYRNLRASYVKAWWNVVNWEEVGNRFNKWR